MLLWQNSVEADLYCTDELTALQVRVGGRRVILMVFYLVISTRGLRQN